MLRRELADLRSDSGGEVVKGVRSGGTEGRYSAGEDRRPSMLWVWKMSVNK